MLFWRSYESLILLFRAVLQRYYLNLLFYCFSDYRKHIRCFGKIGDDFLKKRSSFVLVQKFIEELFSFFVPTQNWKRKWYIFFRIIRVTLVDFFPPFLGPKFLCFFVIKSNWCWILFWRRGQKKRVLSLALTAYDPAIDVCMTLHSIISLFDMPLIL